MPVFREEKQRRVHWHLFAGAGLAQSHALGQPSAAKPHKGDAVTVIRVHIRLDLEDKSGEFFLTRRHQALICRPRTWRRRMARQPIQQMRNAEIAQCRAEIDRRQRPFQKAIRIECGIAGARQQHFFGKRQSPVIPHQRGEFRVFRRFKLDRLRAFRHGQEAVCRQIINPCEVRRAAHGPGGRRCIQRQQVLDFIQQFERFACFAVHLVDEGDDRNIAHAANFKQLARLALNPLRRIQHHHGGIHRGQGAIGIFRKILVAWRVQQVEDHAVTFKSHDGGRNRNPAILFNFHPVGTRAPRIALGAHRAGKLNGAALEQQFFGQRGFARIRMGDDGKAPPAGGFFGDTGGRD